MDALDALLDRLIGKQQPVTLYSIHDPNGYRPHELRIVCDVVEQLDRGPFLFLMAPGGKG